MRKIKSIFIQKCFTIFVQFTIIMDIVAGNSSVRILSQKERRIMGFFPSKAPVPADVSQLGDEEKGVSKGLSSPKTSADALPYVSICVTQSENMQVTAKQRGCDWRKRSNGCEFALPFH